MYDHDLTPAQKTTKAKKHYIGALYHSVFYDRTSKRIISHLGAINESNDGVSPTEAQILIANKMALLRVGEDGTCWLSETLHGAKQHGKHSALNVKRSGNTETLSSYPRNRGHDPIDLRAVFDACCAYAYRFNMGKMY